MPVPVDGLWRSLVSALRSGRRGPRFKSGQPDCTIEAKATLRRLACRQEIPRRCVVIGVQSDARLRQAAIRAWADALCEEC